MNMSREDNGPASTIVPMTPDARRLYEEEFLPRYKELLESVERTPLVILVWGPGPSGEDLYEKRVQILNALRTCGHTALSSEQIDADCPIKYMSAKARELLQAKAANFIVVIQGSPGSTAEVHDFAGFIQDIGPKMLIFIDERFREGYSYTEHYMRMLRPISIQGT